MRWWPRSIRWQMLAGLLLLEILSIGLFAAAADSAADPPHQSTRAVLAGVRVDRPRQCSRLRRSSSSGRVGWIWPCVPSSTRRLCSRPKSSAPQAKCFSSASVKQEPGNLSAGRARADSSSPARSVENLQNRQWRMGSDPAHLHGEQSARLCLCNLRPKRGAPAVGFALETTRPSSAASGSWLPRCWCC